MSFPTLTRADVWRLLRNERGRPLREVSWTRPFLDALDDPAVSLVLVWAKRQVGKTTHTVAGIASELFCRPGSYSVYVGAAERQAEAAFSRKLRRPLEQLARELGVADRLRITQRTVEVPDLGSAFECMATNDVTAPGRSVDKLFLDECRSISDRVFEVLAPSIIGSSGQIVASSTAGAPRGFFHRLVSDPPEGALLIHPDTNENPDASARVLGFLERLFRIFPAAGRRELDNVFEEDGDVLIPAAVIESCIDPELTEAP